MRYLRMNLVASTTPVYCHAGRIEGSNAAELAIEVGASAFRRYPGDARDVLVHLDVAQRGVGLPDRIANTSQLLMWSRAAVVTLATALTLGPHDVHGFTLVNHKRRVHSRDYVFVNPRTHADIAHADAEFARFESTCAIFACERWVLDRRKLDGLPDLVRSARVPNEYFASERLCERVASTGLSNFVFEQVEHR